MTFIKTYEVSTTAAKGRTIYTKLTHWDNLLLAYRKAAKGKRGQANVAAFEHRLEDNLLLLQAELADQTYRPGPYTSFTIHEPKRRLISAAPFSQGPPSGRGPGTGDRGLGNRPPSDS